MQSDLNKKKMELKTIKFKNIDSNGNVVYITWNNCPVYTQKEMEELKKTVPEVYQMLQAF